MSLLSAADLLWQSVSADLVSRAPSPGGDHADVAQAYEHRVLGGPFLIHAAPFLMLAGFAIEDALKAVRVKQKKDGATTLGKKGMKLSDDLHTHDLRHLAVTAGISLSPTDTELLDRLTAYLEWAGRYPVAATANNRAAFQNIYASDRAAVQEFFDRLVAML